MANQKAPETGNRNPNPQQQQNTPQQQDQTRTPQSGQQPGKPDTTRTDPNSGTERSQTNPTGTNTSRPTGSRSDEGDLNDENTKPRPAGSSTNDR